MVGQRRNYVAKHLRTYNKSKVEPNKKKRMKNGYSKFNKSVYLSGH